MLKTAFGITLIPTEYGRMGEYSGMVWFDEQAQFFPNLQLYEYV